MHWPKEKDGIECLVADHEDARERNHVNLVRGAKRHDRELREPTGQGPRRESFLGHGPCTGFTARMIHRHLSFNRARAAVIDWPCLPL